MNAINTKAAIEPFAAVTEPVFYFGLEKGRSIPPSMEPTRLKNYFEYALKQKPENLACHIQRIKFSLQQKNQQELFAALCDLFIILGQQGQDLRQRLYDYLQHQLSQEQQAILASHLNADGLNNNSPALPEPCLFKHTDTQLFELEAATESRTETMAAGTTEDSLLTIESYIENSQFDMAEELLIKQLNNEPENEVLTTKLISLYKALDDIELFNKTYSQFSNCLLTSHHWEAAARYFLEKSQ